MGILGKKSTIRAPEHVAHILKKQEITIFHRITHNGQVLYSKSYPRVKAQNSYTVQFSENRHKMFGHILYFTMCDEPTAIISILTPTSSKTHFQLTFHSLDSRLFPVTATNIVKVVPVKNITEKCIFIDVGMYFIGRFTTQVCLD